MVHNALMDKDGVFRVATWNIHKGVRGVGPARRLEIHDIGHGVEQLDADVVCLQEVRKVHRRGQDHFARWPAQPQAEYLAPLGYEAVYRTNAYTRDGEHGNALLTRWPVVTTSTRTCRTTVSSNAACCMWRSGWPIGRCM